MSLPGLWVEPARTQNTPPVQVLIIVRKIAADVCCSVSASAYPACGPKLDTASPNSNLDTTKPKVPQSARGVSGSVM